MKELEFLIKNGTNNQLNAFIDKIDGRGEFFKHDAHSRLFIRDIINILSAEHITKHVFTKKELEVMKFLRDYTKIKYITRDESGSLYGSTSRPYKIGRCAEVDDFLPCWHANDKNIWYLLDEMFPEVPFKSIEYSDAEPVELDALAL